MCKLSWDRLKTTAKEVWTITINEIKADFLVMSRFSMALFAGAVLAFIVVATLLDARLAKTHHEEQAVVNGFSKTIESQQTTIRALNDQVTSLKQQLGQKKDVASPPVTGQPVIHNNGSDISVVTVVTIPQQQGKSD